MNFSTAVQTLNETLQSNEPKTFSSSWIWTHAQPVYQYVRLHFRTENDDIDWDVLTAALNRRFQKRWVRYRRKQVKLYENQTEVDRILDTYRDRLYTFIAPCDEKDRRARNRIIIALVRIAQKGNALAQRELIVWLTYVVDDWIEKYWQICRWEGYTDETKEKIAGCIRCYKYTGSFLGYLFKTLEYSARGKAPLQAFSFDDPVLDGTKTRIDYFVQK